MTTNPSGSPAQSDHQLAATMHWIGIAAGLAATVSLVDPRTGTLALTAVILGIALRLVVLTVQLLTQHEWPLGVRGALLLSLLTFAWWRAITT